MSMPNYENIDKSEMWYNIDSPYICPDFMQIFLAEKPDIFRCICSNPYRFVYDQGTVLCLFGQGTEDMVVLYPCFHLRPL